MMTVSIHDCSIGWKWERSLLDEHNTKKYTIVV